MKAGSSEIKSSVDFFSVWLETALTDIVDCIRAVSKATELRRLHMIASKDQQTDRCRIGNPVSHGGQSAHQRFIQSRRVGSRALLKFAVEQRNAALGN